MTDREKAIKDLEDIIATAEGIKGLPSQYGGITISLDKIESLRFALESIKVDRAYDLAYEKVDFIEIPEGANNGEVFEKLMREAYPKMLTIYGRNEDTKTIAPIFNEDWWNSPYRKDQRNE